MTAHFHFVTAQDVDAAQEIHAPRATVKAIVQELAAATGVTADQITGKSRKAEIVRVRQIVCFIARQKGMTYQQIGRVLNRDHTTIVAAVKREAARRHSTIHSPSCSES
ncbi:helix-turn-helix domain-containing protein [Paracoccus siganidrum]|uniref:Chromosomal replication initiator DnaA n=1 Tax=Paracoccus siganidrum TaxID=1276757 RepID=A0A419A976_9RHOB|nr:helix-turn-helix domain-containing protein [Paracoccus siganidrum]RJL18647.1 chromosomal replication initiator DnaA [Paracoccus siganidrum]RMC36845.1 chromosomal replication initiator DnaA [Paracoccus siganidrum]